MLSVRTLRFGKYQHGLPKLGTIKKKEGNGLSVLRRTDTSLSSSWIWSISLTSLNDLTPYQLADDVIQQYTDSIMKGQKLDLHKLILAALKIEYKRGYKTAKEKFRNANTSHS